jgi:hypothetical protein
VAVAYGAGQYLVAYSDTVGGEDYPGLFGVTVSPKGEAGQPFGISPAPAYDLTASSPSIAFDGKRFLVAYTSWGKERGIYGAYVSGGARDGDEFAIASGKGSMTSPSVAFGAGTYLVAWTDTPPGVIDTEQSDIAAALVTRDGKVGKKISIAQLDGPQGLPVATFHQKSFFVFWVDFPAPNPFAPSQDESLHATRVAPTGEIQSGSPRGPGLLISNQKSSKKSISAVSFGNKLVVTWAANFYNNTDQPAGIFMSFLSEDGKVIGDPAFPWSVSGPPTEYASKFVHPAVSTNGSSLLIDWVNNLEMQGGAHSLEAFLMGSF